MWAQLNRVAGVGSVEQGCEWGFSRKELWVWVQLNRVADVGSVEQDCGCGFS